MMTNDQKLDALFGGSELCLEDDGFTVRVLERLPTRRSRWVQAMVVTLLGVVGALVAFWILPAPVRDWASVVNLALPLSLIGAFVLVAGALSSLFDSEDDGQSLTSGG
jgi:uncharacterized membrane protein YeaQ/YmgE (transglycosylase-associated protein family)